MAKDLLRYDKMIESAMRGVVRQAISEAAKHGLPGAHHFYISFRTDHPGTTVPDYLKSRYPQEMTIVLQYQFWGLDVEEESFSVTLSFNNVHERLTVPFQAVTVFADPAAKFTLPFQASAAQAGQAPAAALERRRAVGHPVTDVVEPLAPGLERLRHRRIGPGRRQQLDVGLGHLEEGLLDAVGLDDLTVLDLHPERVAVVGDGGLEVTDGDGDVVDLDERHGGTPGSEDDGDQPWKRR